MSTSENDARERNKDREDNNDREHNVRRNAATISVEDRNRLSQAILEVNNKKYPDGVSYWFKQDQIHEATEVHDGPAFLTWHRELLNRYEAMLKEVDEEVSLHYWDWTTDPQKSPDGRGGFVNLFTSEFMGSANGGVGAPFAGKLDNNGILEGSRNQTNSPVDPPQQITRNVQAGAPPITPDSAIINSANNLPQADQWASFRVTLEGGIHHNRMHGWIGGNIASGRTAFEDPFVYLFHANIDRLWAMWQTAPGYGWRLDADQTYGREGTNPGILKNMEPWAGTVGLRPWASPDNQQFAKTSKHPSIILPPVYDTMNIQQAAKMKESSAQPIT